ncbi:NUDIX domain-containing protein [Hypoxylon rubiginosum]|uniref:NUDIX domain-containing protein n=1 Tax=Hypoxylon rubiginosum TaxID=110542 RepID=A0ACC0D5N4_9PEZI|nr:NUDIX domain-containing protein [Hypoxylon rubiginosum]
MASPPKTYLNLVKASYAEPPDPVFYQFLLPGDSRPHGFIHPSVVAKMPWTSEFEVSAADVRPRTVRVLDSSSGNDTAAACSTALLGVIQIAAEADIFPSLSRRDLTETMRIPGAKYPLVRLQRAAAGLFGIARRSAHLIMYTRTPEGQIKIWVQRRSAHLSTYPGKLDSTVADGLYADESPFQCIMHEADDKASLPQSLVRRQVRSCGAITYTCTSDVGSGFEAEAMISNILYVYGMEVDHTVIPKPKNKKVDEFNLWSVQQIKNALFRGEFKTNCVLVMIDFFIRHGIINDTNEPDYLEIISRLHRDLPMPISAKQMH